MRGQSIAPAPAVDLLDDEPLEIELATTLLYEHSRHSYRQLREAVLGSRARGGARRSSTSACAIAAAMTSCCAPTAPDRSSALTF